MRTIRPPPSSQPTHDLIALCTKFVEEVKDFTRASDQHQQLVQQLNAAFADFKVDLGNTRRLSVPFEKTSEKRDGYSEGIEGSNAVEPVDEKGRLRMDLDDVRSNRH